MAFLGSGNRGLQCGIWGRGGISALQEVRVCDEADVTQPAHYMQET